MLPLWVIHLDVKVALVEHVDAAVGADIDLARQVHQVALIFAAAADDEILDQLDAVALALIEGNGCVTEDLGVVRNRDRPGVGKRRWRTGFAEIAGSGFRACNTQQRHGGRGQNHGEERLRGTGAQSVHAGLHGGESGAPIVYFRHRAAPVDIASP